MATKQAHFRTGKDQYEIVVDAIVKEDLTVGSLCTYNPTSKELIGATTAAAGTYIVAQSDQSMEYGHIPVENRDYRYDSKVATSTAVKKVALFRINDVADIIVIN